MYKFTPDANFSLWGLRPQTPNQGLSMDHTSFPLLPTFGSPMQISWSGSILYDETTFAPELYARMSQRQRAQNAERYGVREGMRSG